MAKKKREKPQGIDVLVGVMLGVIAFLLLIKVSDILFQK